MDKHHRIKKNMIDGYRTIIQEYLPLIENERIAGGREIIITYEGNPTALKFDINESYLPSSTNRYYRLTAFLVPEKGKPLKIKEINGKRDKNLEVEILKIVIEDWQGMNILNKVFRDIKIKDE